MQTHNVEYSSSQSVSSFPSEKDSRGLHRSARRSMLSFLCTPADLIKIEDVVNRSQWCHACFSADNEHVIGGSTSATEQADARP
eukprot:2052552-Pleurochrysis_carterae.AAC.1